MNNGFSWSWQFIIRTLHCSVSYGAISKGAKGENDTVQSISCGWLTVIWNSDSVAKRPKTL